MERRNRTGHHIPGFLPSRNQAKPISSIHDVSELNEVLHKTEALLATCSSALRQKLQARRAECEARLRYLSSMRAVETDLKSTHIDPYARVSTPPPPCEDVTMADGQGEGPSVIRGPVATKLRILNTPVVMREQTHNPTHSTATLDHREAIRIQQVESERAIARQRQTERARTAREERLLPRGSRWDTLSVRDRDNAILAFMRARPTESDQEYDEDSEDELDDELMETMLDAEFEDGTKGQNILAPDDLSDIIRVQVPPDIVHLGDRQSGG